MKQEPYHYTESGLDYIYLKNGFRFVSGNRGDAIIIENIDGLHDAIGRLLVNERKNLTGEEIRFLRHELEMSQSTLSVLLGVEEQTLARWERGDTDEPNPIGVRMIKKIYSEKFGEDEKITDLLYRLAELEDRIDQHLEMEETEGDWKEAA